MGKFNTPYFEAEQRTFVKEGIYLYEGGLDRIIFLEEFRNQQVHPCIRINSGWYRESNFADLALVFPEIFPEEWAKNIDAFVRKTMPEIWEEISKVTLLPTKESSPEKHREKWYEKHKNDWIEHVSWADTHPNVKPGHVLIRAAWGGDIEEGNELFLVPKEEYENSREEYGFVIDVHRHISCKEVKDEPKLKLVQSLKEGPLTTE